MPDDIPPSLFSLLREDLAQMRGEFNGRLDNIASQSISSTTYNQGLTHQKERDDRQDARIKELEAANDEARKTKAQQWFAIGAAILGSVLAIIGGVVIWTIQQGLQQVLSGVTGP